MTNASTCNRFRGVHCRCCVVVKLVVSYPENDSFQTGYYFHVPSQMLGRYMPSGNACGMKLINCLYSSSTVPKNCWMYQSLKSYPQNSCCFTEILALMTYELRGVSFCPADQPPSPLPSATIARVASTSEWGHDYQKNDTNHRAATKNNTFNPGKTSSLNTLNFIFYNVCLQFAALVCDIAVNSIRNSSKTPCASRWNY